MKKVKMLEVIISLMCLTSCGSNTSDNDSTYKIDAKSINDNISSIEGTNSIEESTTSDTEYDIDLTKMNSSMVYAQVADMVNRGDDYLGKSVKANGTFGYYKETDGREFFAVLISDATACCSQGIEFVLDGDYSYPDDYPLLGTNITVTGDFNYYKEGVATYCQLLHAHMTVN
ncbi:hypothetical protein [Ruminococcus sp.]|uniref:hypothetical protein n=1 Tax=Ruminococcus sp. TaxID=41978 RepID=UPI0025E86AF1|nr:hypothetical protein [Ruminococcus sp.]